MDTIMEQDMLTHFLQAEDTKEKAMKVQEALERDPAVKAALEAASSFEELYEVFKRYLVMKFEDFKNFAQESVILSVRKRWHSLMRLWMPWWVAGAFGALWRNTKQSSSLLPS